MEMEIARSIDLLICVSCYLLSSTLYIYIYIPFSVCLKQEKIRVLAHSHTSPFLSVLESLRHGVQVMELLLLLLFCHQSSHGARGLEGSGHGQRDGDGAGRIQIVVAPTIRPVQLPSVRRSP